MQDPNIFMLAITLKITMNPTPLLLLLFNLIIIIISIEHVTINIGIK